MMEAKTNKERCPRCGNPAPIAQFNQPYCLGCPSCLHTWETETVDDLKSRLESAEKQIADLEAVKSDSRYPLLLKGKQSELEKSYAEISRLRGLIYWLVPDEQALAELRCCYSGTERFEAIDQIVKEERGEK